MPLRTLVTDPISFGMPCDEWREHAHNLLLEIKNNYKDEKKKHAAYDEYIEKKEDFEGLMGLIGQVEDIQLGQLKKLKLTPDLHCYVQECGDWSAYYFMPDSNRNDIFGFLITYGSRSTKNVLHELRISLTRLSSKRAGG